MSHIPLLAAAGHRRLAQGGGGGEEPPPPPPAGEFLIGSAAFLQSRPSSGAEYSALVSSANTGRDRGAGVSGSTTPGTSTFWLPNYNNGSNSRTATHTLNAAIYGYLESSTAHINAVKNQIRFAMGSEESAAAGDTTSTADRLLSTQRQFPALILAAQLVDLDPETTGSRPGHTGKVFHEWVAAMRTKSIGSHSRWTTFTNCQNTSGSNWGGFATASRIAANLYLESLGQTVPDLAASIAKFQRWLGDRTKSTQFTNTADFDSSYVYLDAGSSPTSDWIAVNNAAPAGVGSTTWTRKDGMCVEDMSRSTNAYSSSGTLGSDDGWEYSAEVLSGMYGAAVFLSNSGYPEVWDWGANTAGGGQALKRTMDFAQRFNNTVTWGSQNYGVNHHLAWIPQFFYDTDYTTTTAKQGRFWGNTDWLYGTPA